MTAKLCAIACAAALVLAAAACSGSSSNDQSTSESTIGSEEFGLSDKKLNARIDDAEAMITECMTNAGFEYSPVPAATVRDAMGADKSLPGMNEEDFVAEYGFGITTVFTDPVADLGRGEQNSRIYEALPDADKVAYDRALTGETGVALARAIEDEDLSQTDGCTGDALDQLFTSEEATSAYINPGDVLIEQDSRVIKALGSWSDCMRDAGFVYDHPDAVEEELHERFDAIVGDADPATLTGPDAEALTELQGFERAVAGEVLRCEEERLEPVVSEVEQEVYGREPS